MLYQESQRSALPVELQRAAEIPISEDLLVQARSQGISLTEILEDLDPTAPEGGLDAFERQLALAGIRVSGTSADTIDRFFASTETAVLFPEFVSRSIRTGKTDFKALDRIVASRTRIDSDTYKTLYKVDLFPPQPYNRRYLLWRGHLGNENGDFLYEVFNA